jgi:demethylmenaquinone methyltransferase/2-methoxy-6-polyprenyl-1,4-benzoquinol methylase
MMSTTTIDKSASRIRGMFGAIAPTYDLLNHLLSCNVDRYWRWKTTQLVPRTLEYLSSMCAQVREI